MFFTRSSITGNGIWTKSDVHLPYIISIPKVTFALDKMPIFIQSYAALMYGLRQFSVYRNTFLQSYGYP